MVRRRVVQRHQQPGRHQTGRFWNRTGTVEPNRRKPNSLRTVGTVNRWNRMQNRTGGTGTVLPSSGPSPNKLIGKIVIAFWVQCKKQIWDSSIKTCMHWQFQEALVFPSSARGRKRGWESGLGKGGKTRWQKEGIKKTIWFAFFTLLKKQKQNFPEIPTTFGTLYLAVRLQQLFHFRSER